MPDRPWFEPDGLSFTCTQCGDCCTGPPGFVWFSDEEAAALAAYLRLEVGEFRRRFARKIWGRWTLGEIETDHGFDCVFLRRDENGKALCAVYPVRPKQCRTWPFWPENLKSKRAWEQTARRCPGMNTGKVYPPDQIRIIRDSNDGQ